MKVVKLFNLIKPLLALLLVFFCAELSFAIFNNYGRVLPYVDYFTHKRKSFSILKGEPWDKIEFSNKLYRNKMFQHVKPLPDFSNFKTKNVYLLGDSITESASTPISASFHSITDEKNDSINIVPFHFGGCSLKTLVYYMSIYPKFFMRDSKPFKPDLIVLQLRSTSYRGGNTNIFDPKIGKYRDFQDKLPVDLNKAPIVALKDKFLKNFSLDIKFSSKLKDKLFREVVLGESKILSFFAWRIFQWSTRITSKAPNHENFFVYPNELNEMYWQRFEKSVQLLTQQSKALGIPIAVLLVPQPDCYQEYKYTHKYNEQEVRYQNLFAKYAIPFEYGIEEFELHDAKTEEVLYWEDRHPSIEGNKALAVALDNLLEKVGF